MGKKEMHRNKKKIGFCKDCDFLVKNAAGKTYHYETQSKDSTSRGDVDLTSTFPQTCIDHIIKQKQWFNQQFLEATDYKAEAIATGDVLYPCDFVLPLTDSGCQTFLTDLCNRLYQPIEELGSGKPGDKKDSKDEKKKDSEEPGSGKPGDKKDSEDKEKKD